MTAIGLDLGGSSLKIARLDGDVLTPMGRVPHEARGLEAVVATVATAVRSLGSAEARLPLGLAVAGLVRGALVARSGNLQLTDAPVRAAVEGAIGRSLGAFLSDAEATGIAATGEPGDEPVRLALALGTGVGGALVVARAVVAAEGFGHAEIVPEEAEAPCAIGHRRCLEAFLGAQAWGGGGAGALDLIAEQGDARARELLRRAGRILGEGARALLVSRGFGRAFLGDVPQRGPALILSGGTASSRTLIDSTRNAFGGRVTIARFGAFTAAAGAAMAVGRSTM